MSNFVYNGGKAALLEGRVNWLSDDIRAILLDTAHYTPSRAHATLADVPVPARIAVSGTLTGRTAHNGVASSSGAAWTGLPSASCEALAIVKVTGVDNTSILVCFIDTALGLPVTPSTGGNGSVTWLHDQIFSL
jgi:hypothetical protein